MWLADASEEPADGLKQLMRRVSLLVFGLSAKTHR